MTLKVYDLIKKNLICIHKCKRYCKQFVYVYCSDIVCKNTILHLIKVLLTNIVQKSNFHWLLLFRTHILNNKRLAVIIL